MKNINKNNNNNNNNNSYTNISSNLKNRSRSISLEYNKKEKYYNKHNSLDSNYNTNNYKEFKKSLPIYNKKVEIISSIKNSNILIITGETGSGKTTQLPQYILEAFPNSKVVITQPRRVAAIQMAQRVSKEYGCKLGYEVGYTVRFNDKSNNYTKIKYVTDGILVREIINMSNKYNVNNNINANNNNSCNSSSISSHCNNTNISNLYDFIIIDEAHERSLYTDILLSLCKEAVANSNGKLKLIVTTATLDKNLFLSYFNNCPLINVEGSMYPVDISYNPCKIDKRIESAVDLAIRIHLHEDQGHILVFLTGYDECEKACKLAYESLTKLADKVNQFKNNDNNKNNLISQNDRYNETNNIAYKDSDSNIYNCPELKYSELSIKPINIMPLYGSQDTDDQNRVFEESNNCRKLIFCTNIAETSLTINNVRYVIDSGYIKQKSYNPKTNIDSLAIVPISKVQAVQRLGRAGRTSPGKCIRLYSYSFFENQMSGSLMPEILRSNLSNTILNLKVIGIKDVYNMDLIDKPSNEYILHALKHLYFIKAIDKEGHLTALGREIAKLPIECSYARSLIASYYLKVEDKMLSLVSLISTDNIYITVSKFDEELRNDFDKKKNEFLNEYSDHLSLLNIYNEFNKIKELQALNNHNNDNRLINWCKNNYINIRSLNKAENIKYQLKNSLNKINFKLCEKYYNLDLLNYLRKEIKTGLLEIYCNQTNTNKIKSINKYEQTDILIRIALSQGFYMNTAKKVANINDDRYIKLSDASLVYMDNSSSIIKYNLLQNSNNIVLPNIVVFTELSNINHVNTNNSISKTTMKTVSIIEFKWVVDLVKLIKDLDVSKLIKENKKQDAININDAKSTFTKLSNNTSLMSYDLYNIFDKKSIDIEKINYFKEELQNKANEARERYLNRKNTNNKNK